MADGAYHVDADGLVVVHRRRETLAEIWASLLPTSADTAEACGRACRWGMDWTRASALSATHCVARTRRALRRRRLTVDRTEKRPL